MSHGLSHVISKDDELKNLRKKIEEDKPKPTDMKILNPSDDSDWKMIKSYNWVWSNSRILISCFKCRGVVSKDYYRVCIERVAILLLVACRET